LAGAVVFPAGAPVRRRLPPWVRQLAIAPARGVLPLDLAREAGAARRTVGRGLRMVDAVDGVLAARGASAVEGLSVALRGAAVPRLHAALVGFTADLGAIQAIVAELRQKARVFVVGAPPSRRTDPKASAAHPPHFGRTRVRRRRVGSVARRRVLQRLRRAAVAGWRSALCDDAAARRGLGLGCLFAGAVLAAPERERGGRQGDRGRWPGRADPGGAERAWPK